MRGAAAILAVLLVVVALGTFAWMTHHPEARILEEAEAWPWVGPFVVRFREAYVDQPAPPVGDDESAIEYEIRYEPDPRVGGPDGPIDLREVAGLEATPAPRGALPFVWVAAGERLLVRADPAAALVHEYVEPERLAVLERRGDWYRVKPHGVSPRRAAEAERMGWVHLPGYSELADPPFGSAPRRLGPLPSSPPPPELLAAARALMEGEREWRVGPYRLYSDGGDAALFDWLDRVVTNLEPTYRARYGVAPRGSAEEVIVLFAGESQYRRLQADQVTGSDRSVGGHAFRGMAATWIGDRPARILGGVVLHELVHLLNRRAIGPALPPWLDEGLAEDIALSALTPEGEILVDRLGGVRRNVGGDTVVTEGGLGSLLALRKALRTGSAPTPAELLADDWGPIGERRKLLYAYAGLLVRYLERPESPAGATLDRFILRVSRGKPRLERPFSRLLKMMGDPS